MTTLVQDTNRSTDATFRAQVRAVMGRELPDIIGEAVTTPPSHRAATEAQRVKRHAWAMEVLRDIAQGAVWLDRVCWLLAGENQIQAVPYVPGAPIDDAVIAARFRALVNDFSGVQAGE